MDTAPSSALPTKGVCDVPIDGLPSGGCGVVQTQTASAGLRLVCPIPKTNPILKMASRTRPARCRRDHLSHVVRRSSSPDWAGARKRRWKVNRGVLSPVFSSNLIISNVRTANGPRLLTGTQKLRSMGNENNATKVSNKEKAQAKPTSTGIHRAAKARHGKHANSSSIPRCNVEPFLT